MKSQSRLLLLSVLLGLSQSSSVSCAQEVIDADLKDFADKDEVTSTRTSLSLQERLKVAQISAWLKANKGLGISGALNVVELAALLTLGFMLRSANAENVKATGELTAAVSAKTAAETAKTNAEAAKVAAESALAAAKLAHAGVLGAHAEGGSVVPSTDPAPARRAATPPPVDTAEGGSVVPSTDPAPARRAATPPPVDTAEGGSVVPSTDPAPAPRAATPPPTDAPAPAPAPAAAVSTA